MDSLNQINLDGPADLPALSYVPNGGLITYVHASGAAALDRLPTGMPNASGGFETSINAALGKCRANRGDTVFVLPGHTESIAAADGWSNLVAGVNIIGLGPRGQRPKITWTAAASTVLLDQDNVLLQNMSLFMEPGTGGVVVTAAMTISGAYNTLRNITARVGTDAANHVTKGIITTDAADDLTIEDAWIYGSADCGITNAIELVGAHRHRFRRLRVNTGTSGVAVGPVKFVTTASTGFLWDDVIIKNLTAASTGAVVGMAGIEGQIANLTLCTLADDNLTNAWTVSFGSVQFGPNCGIVNKIAETPGLIAAASA